MSLEKPHYLEIRTALMLRHVATKAPSSLRTWKKEERVYPTLLYKISLRKVFDAVFCSLWFFILVSIVVTFSDFFYNDLLDHTK